MYNQSLKTDPSVSKGLVIVIEDSEEDYEMLLRVIKKKSIECHLMHFEKGEDALDFLLHRGAYQNSQSFCKPSMILLDLNIPGLDGRIVLERIKTNPDLKSIPTVIFTTSSNPKDIAICYDKGANAYVIKPMHVPQLQECIELIFKHWLTINVVKVI